MVLKVQPPSNALYLLDLWRWVCERQREPVTDIGTRIAPFQQRVVWFFPVIGTVAAVLIDGVRPGISGDEIDSFVKPRCFSVTCRPW